MPFKCHKIQNLPPSAPPALLVLHKGFKEAQNQAILVQSCKPQALLCNIPPGSDAESWIDPGSRMRLCHSSPSVKGKDTAKLQRSLQLAKDFPCSSITSSRALFVWAAWLQLTKQTWLLGATPSHPQLSFPDFSVRIKPRSGQPIEGPGLPGAPALHVQFTLCFLPLHS